MPANVVVPEAAMYEDDLAAGAEDQVGLSRQIASVQAIAESHGMGEAPHLHLWFCVFAGYCSHA